MIERIAIIVLVAALIWAGLKILELRQRVGNLSMDNRILRRFLKENKT